MELGNGWAGFITSRWERSFCKVLVFSFFFLKGGVCWRGGGECGFGYTVGGKCPPKGWGTGRSHPRSSHPRKAPGNPSLRSLPALPAHPQGPPTPGKRRGLGRGRDPLSLTRAPASGRSARGSRPRRGARRGACLAGAGRRGRWRLALGAAAGRGGRPAPCPGGGRQQEQQEQQRRRPPRGARRGHGGGAPRSHAGRAGGRGRPRARGAAAAAARGREVSEVRLRAPSPPQKLWEPREGGRGQGGRAAEAAPAPLHANEPGRGAAGGSSSG